MKARNTTVGTFNQKKKNIATQMINAIKKYQKHLQLKENVKFGRKARNISFVFATQKPKDFAKFLMEDSRK